MKIIKILTITLVFIEISLHVKIFVDKNLKSNFFITKQPSTFNILILGDSVSANYPKFLKQRLESKYKEKKFKITQHILPSARIIEMNSTIERLIKEYRPSLVISMLGKAEILSSETKAITPIKNLAEPFYKKILLYRLGSALIENFVLKLNDYTLKRDSVEDGTSAYKDIADTEGKKLLKAKNYNEALVYFMARLEQDKTSYEILSIVSELQIKLGQFQEATSSLKKLIERDPDDAANYNALSFAYQQMNDYKNAFFWANRGNKIFPTSPSIIKRIIELSEIFGRHNDFLTYTTKLDKVSGQKAFANFYFGRYYYMKKSYSKSLTFFKSALLDHPDQSLIHLHLGHTYLELGQKENSLSEYHQAVKGDLFNNNKHFNFLIRAVEFNKLNIAKEFYIDELLEKYPNEERFFIPISRTLLELKRYKESYSLLSRFLNKYPTDTYANKTLSILKSETKNLKGLNFNKFIPGKDKKPHFYTRDLPRVYPLLVQTILNSNSSLIIMQYPDMLLSDLQKIKFPKSSKLLLIDNLNLIKNQGDQDISKYFVWDAIHLSELGDKILVDNLIIEIDKNNLIE